MRLDDFTELELDREFTFVHDEHGHRQHHDSDQ
jgi:hypothetical protein